MTLTKEQKDFAIKELNGQFSHIDLKCDGYDIRLSLERVQDLKLAVEVFVNHWVLGEWLVHPEKFPESKFFPNRFRSLYSPVKKKTILKKFGKRRAYELFPELDKKFEYKGTHFCSGRTAINHLLKVCDSVELVTEMPS